MSLTVMFGTLGLAVDLGWAYYQRGTAQSAADAAALAAATYAQNNGYSCGANGVVCGAVITCANPPVNPPTSDLESGCIYAQVNGYATGNGTTVTLTGNTTAPPGVNGNAPAYWVRANISRSLSNTFGFVGSNLPALNVNASSTAAISISPPSGCIYVLSTNATNALSLTGSSSATSSCGIFINSSATPALKVTGSSILHSTQILINGGTYSVTGSSVVSPTPDTNGGGVADPLASLEMPAVGGCDHTNYSVTGSATVTVSPGVYCGGISISSSSTVNFDAGIYTLNGGGLQVTGSSILNGTGVMFFNTGQNGHAATAISIAGSSVVNVSAPTSGTWQGMLFVQDRNVSYAGTNSITGSSTSSYTGTLYFPTTAVTFSGSSAGTFTALVVKTLTLTGSSTIRNDPTGAHTGLAHKVTTIID